MKMTRKILSLLLVLAMCLCMFTACGENNNTENSSKNDTDETTTSTKDKNNGGGSGAIGGWLDDLAGNEADPAEDPYNAIVRAWALTVQDAGASYLSMLDSIPAIVDDTATYEMAVDMNGVKADLTAVVNPEKLTASADVHVDAQGINTEASLWLGDDIAVSVPDLLGDKAYGFKLSSLMDDLDNSWLLSMLNVDSADALLDTLLSQSGISMGDLEELETALDDLGKLESAITDTLTETVEDLSGELATYIDGLDTEVTANGDVTVITTTVTSDDFADLMVILADTLETTMDSLMNGMMGDMLGDMTGAELNMDELRDNANNMRGEPGELLIVHTLAKSGKLQKFEIGFVDENGEQQDENVAIVFANGDAFGFEVFVEGISLISFKSLGGDKEGFELTISEEDATILFERNKSNGDFTVEGKSHGETAMMIKGNLQYGSDKFAIELDSVTMDGETMELGFKISMKAGGKVKALPNYQNVLTMSESQLQSLMTSVQNSPLIQDMM